MAARIVMPLLHQWACLIWQHSVFQVGVVLFLLLLFLVIHIIDLSIICNAFLIKSLIQKFDSSVLCLILCTTV